MRTIIDDALALHMLWFGESKGEITLAVNQFEVEAIVYWYATAQLIKNDISKSMTTVTADRT
jgi:hypothetical protein